MKLRKSADGKTHEEEIMAALVAFIDAHDSPLMKSLRKLWEKQRDEVDVATIEDEMRAGTMTMETLAQWEQDYLDWIHEHLEEIYILAMGAAASAQLSKLQFQLDTEAAQVEEWLNTHAQTLAQILSRTQYDALQSLIASSVATALDVAELATLAHSLIGLTERQSLAVLRYYESMIGNDVKDEVALKRAQVQTRKYEKARSRNIAWTEMADAFNEGSTQAVEQAQEQGLMGAVDKTWYTAEDERVCDICAPLDGVTVGQYETFPGGFERPHAHPLCRCVVVYQEVSAVA